MALREVKERIASVRSTLKITSAMKLVASSKLRKAQRAIEALRPYEETLTRILAAACGSTAPEVPPDSVTPHAAESVIVLAFSSNTSMCGAFNANVIKKALEVIRAQKGSVEVWAFGKKMADALKKAGIPAARDYSHLLAAPSSAETAAISAELRSMLAGGRIGSVILVYNHFVSTGRQLVVAEPWGVSLGRETQSVDDQVFGQNNLPQKREVENGKPLSDKELHFTATGLLMEPSRPELLASLVPQVMDLKVYAALLDSVASEHAARMIAMQTATDNAEQLLSELTLEYNKGRQQKITSEILDIVGGSAQNQ